MTTMNPALILGGLALAGVAITAFARQQPTTEEKEIEDQVKAIVADIDKQIDDAYKAMDAAEMAGDDSDVESTRQEIADLETDREEVVAAGDAAIETIIIEKEVVREVVKEVPVVREVVREVPVVREVVTPTPVPVVQQVVKPAPVVRQIEAGPVLDNVVRRYLAGHLKTPRAVVVAIMQGLQVTEDTANTLYNTIRSRLVRPVEVIDPAIEQRFNKIRDQAIRTYGSHFQVPVFRQGANNTAIIERYIELADEALAREQDYEQAMRDQQKHDDALEEQEAQEEQRRQREQREFKQRQEERRELEDKADYNTQKANLSREFPEERDIINATMGWYKSDWRNYQGDLRRQLIQRTQDRYSQDLNAFNNAKQRIINSYPKGTRALSGWGYDPGWRDDEREMRGDAKRVHDQEVARLKRNADFTRQLQQDIRDRAAAAQESGIPQPRQIYYDDEMEGESYPYIPAPVVAATPTPFIRTVAGTRFGTQEQARAGTSSRAQLAQQEYEAAQLREAYAGDWDEF